MQLPCISKDIFRAAILFSFVLSNISCSLLPINESSSSFGNRCLEWFKNSGLSPSAPNCVIDCDILPKDLGTFACADRCDEFCSQQKCIDNPYWVKKIKLGRPANWALQSEISGSWKSVEQSKLIEFLDRLPDSLEYIPFDGFYRMRKSVDMTNPATTDSTGQVIVVYDRAFNNPFFSTSRVLAHELGHVVYLNFTSADRTDYQNTMGWKDLPDGSKGRPGGFISLRAKDNDDEDFAENINSFLFEPDVLKTKVPLAFNWIEKKFPKSFKLKDDCQHEEK